MGVTSSRSKRDTGRDGGGFVALPWSVLDCPAYALLSHPARGLLIEIARQFVRDNNGRLLASAAYLAARGWTSRDVINRAKKELLDAGFIFETVKGHRPNKAFWYAVTWRALDKNNAYDPGTSTAFMRGEYQISAKTKNDVLRPPHGLVRAPIGPSDGLGGPLSRPSDGPIKSTLGAFPRPSHGHHLDLPSECALVPTQSVRSRPPSTKAINQSTESRTMNTSNPMLKIKPPHANVMEDC